MIKKIIFITQVVIADISKKGIYTDLLRKFVENGHQVVIITPLERKFKEREQLIVQENHTILRIKTFNINKAHKVEKAISLLTIDSLYKRAIKKYFSNIGFDLAVYSTPPSTLTNTIKYLKRTYDLKTYMLLKDIFPQNAVDINMMRQSSLIYKYFRKKEIALYRLSDKIGCMSQANVDYILQNNAFIKKETIEICPNCIEITNVTSDYDRRVSVRSEYSIDQDAKVFIYGGNLGKPQGIDFLISLLDKEKLNANVFFIIIGSGTEYNKLKQWEEANRPKNVIVKGYLPQDEYEEFVRMADVGMILLDFRFTIPNYPSRLLGYLKNSLPVLCLTDPNSDVGLNAIKENYGFHAYSNDVDIASDLISTIAEMRFEELKKMGNIGYSYLKDHFNVDVAYEMIRSSVELK